jgi:hypothetical protein
MLDCDCLRRYVVYSNYLTRNQIMTKYNCHATIEVELRGRLCSMTVYGMGTYRAGTYYDPAEYDMEIVAIENDRGQPISARVESIITSKQWESIVESLWEYED